MNRIGTIVIIVIMICLHGEVARSFDWKYYGAFSRTAGIDELLFYDASDLINSHDSVKLWVRSVLSVDIEQRAAESSVVDIVRKRVAAGYKPPITRIHPEATYAAYLEEAVRDSTIGVTSEILYQIACSDRTIRKITGKAFHPDGSVNLGFGISKWQSIIPQSTADDLAQLVCSPKQNP